ncbi:hypothetical protein J6590_057283 [Homalodisca vitripennis]|nr:hypothetical protein J6590_057283 [Homalodisca vitripennis]
MEHDHVINKSRGGIFVPHRLFPVTFLNEYSMNVAQLLASVMHINTGYIINSQAHTDYYSIKTKHNKAFTEISSKHYKHNIGRSRRNRPVSHGNFDKDKREAIVSLPRKMLVNYTAGNDCRHQKSSTIFNNKKYTEENSV